MYDKQCASADLVTYYRLELLNLITERCGSDPNRQNTELSFREDVFIQQELPELKDAFELLFGQGIKNLTAYEHGRLLDSLARVLCNRVACGIRCATFESVIQESFPEKPLTECRRHSVLFAGVVWQCDWLAENNGIPPPSSKRPITCIDSVTRLACLEYRFEMEFKLQLVDGLRNMVRDSTCNASLRRWSLRACYKLMGKIYADRKVVTEPPTKDEIDQLLLFLPKDDSR